MNIEEAKLIAGIVGEADGGCKHCVGALVRRLNEDFPEFTWEMKNWGDADERIEVTQARDVTVEPAPAQSVKVILGGVDQYGNYTEDEIFCTPEEAERIANFFRNAGFA